MQFDSPTVSSEIIDALKRWPELNTSSWSLTCALTLALKPNVYSDGFLFPLDELQAKQNFRIFMKSLNRASYGSHGGRRHGLKLKVIPVLERELEGRLHYHAAIELPKHLTPADFERAVKKCWFNTNWGDCRHDGIHIKFGADTNWVLTFMLKRRQKSGLEKWIDCIDLNSLNNPITGGRSSLWPNTN